MLDAQTRIVFQPEQAEQILQQCSRSAPRHVAGFWQPDTATIERLEKRLPQALASVWLEHRMSDLNARTKPPVRFGRQYAGLILKGRKFVYVNAFPLDTVDWNKPVRVCDGGDGFFGAEYDPATQAFSDFQFNGAI